MSIPFGDWVVPAAKVGLLLLDKFKLAIRKVVKIANEQPSAYIALDTMARCAMNFTSTPNDVTVREVWYACRPFLLREKLDAIVKLNDELTIDNFVSHLKHPNYIQFFASASCEVAGTASKHLNGSINALDDAKFAYDVLTGIK